MLEKDEIETEKFRQRILKKYSHLFDLNNALFQLAQNMQDSGKIRKNGSLNDVIAFLFAKAYKTFEAVDILCQRGYGQDAVMLTRSLFEILVNARYLLVKGDNTLADKYIRFGAIKIKEYIDKLKEDIKKKKIPPAEEAEIQALINAEETKVEHEYLAVKHLCHNNQRKTWSGKSIREMAEEVGLSYEYNYVYGILSSRVHSDVLSMGDYITLQEERLECVSSETFLTEALRISISFFLKILKVVDQAFQIGFNSRTEEIAKQYSAISSSLSSSLYLPGDG